MLVLMKPDMSPAADPLDKKLAAWLKKSLTKIPPKIDLLLLEWNDGWPTVEAHRAGKPKSLLFSLAGFQRGDAERFDPENPEHLDELSEPAWEVSQSCDLPQSAFTELDPSTLVKRVLTNTKETLSSLARIDLAYGEHEGDLKVFSSGRKTSAAKAQRSPVFFELSVMSGGNSIEKMELGDYDDKQLRDCDRVSGNPGQEVQLFLKKKPRLLDFLFSPGGWLVCSQRAMELFRSATKEIQVFPANVWNQKEQVDGYYIVNLYEKLDCLPDEDVLPPRYKGGPKSFDSGRGYRLKLSEVKDRQVFRINYRHFELVVSQEFRDRFEEAKITGPSWLRRSSVP